MGVYLTARLPSTYQEVEYIQSSGTQYIDTGISVGTSANGEIIEGKIQFNSNTSSQVNGKNKKAALFFGTNTSNKFYASSGNSGTWGATSVTNDYKPHIFKIAQSETKLYIDGTGYSFNGGTLADSSTTNIYIGACSDAGNTNYFCKENIYRFKIWKNGTLVRNFIPCYRKSDNVIGLYDLVNNQFYTNSGTGTFTKGADVTAIPLKNAYIGEVYEYSYDFRGKSSTILTNDGWTIASGTPGFGTYGMYGETVRLTRPTPQGITTAKKIILEYTTYAGASTTSSTWGLGKTVNSSTREGLTRGYFERANNKYSAIMYDRSIDYTATLPTGNSYTEKIVIDLEGKTFTCDMTGQTQKSGTITDTEVTNIRTNSNVIWAYTYMSNNSSGLTSVYICIEK